MILHLGIPEDLVKRVPEVVPGYPDRILPVDDKATAILKKRTLTRLSRPLCANSGHESELAQDPISQTK
jgi:hypothetical protein